MKPETVPKKPPNSLPCEPESPETGTLLHCHSISMHVPCRCGQCTHLCPGVSRLLNTHLHNICAAGSHHQSRHCRGVTEPTANAVGKLCQAGKSDVSHCATKPSQAEEQARDRAGTSMRLCPAGECCSKALGKAEQSRALQLLVVLSSGLGESSPAQAGLQQPKLCWAGSGLPATPAPGALWVERCRKGRNPKV